MSGEKRPIDLHDPDCPMTNSDEESRTVCVCDDTQHAAPDGSHRTVPIGGGFVSNEDEPARCPYGVIPDAALDAAYQAYGWTGERRTSVSEILADVVTAALPHLINDEMVERAARAVHEVSDDVLPFDLHVIEGMGRWSARAQRKGIYQRRERYLTTARAALEAALGGADA